MTDSEINATVRAGDADTLGAPLEPCHRTHYHIVTGKVRGDTTAKDMVGKSFVVAFQDLNNFWLGEGFSLT